MCVSSFRGGVPGGGYMALELNFVSARTNKRHHHLFWDGSNVHTFNLEARSLYKAGVGLQKLITDLDMRYGYKGGV